MHAALADLASYNGGVFSRPQALTAGYTSREIRLLHESRIWRRLRQGVYVDGLRWELASSAERAVLQVAAARLSLSAPSVGSHHFAAMAYGLPLLDDDPPLTLTSVAKARRGSRTDRIHVVRAPLLAEHVESLSGVLFTSPARALVDLAEVLPLAEAVTIADAALHRRLVGAEDVCAVAAALGDPASARRMMAAADGRSESPLESLSRVALVQQGIEPPELQHEIRDAVGQLIGRVDMWWPGYRVIGEADGLMKYDSGDLSVLRAEKLRQERLEQSGNVVVRWTWAEIIGHPEEVARRVRAAFARAERYRSA